jgi:hypothetical protein
MPKPIARPTSIGPAWLRIIAIPHDVRSAQTKNCTNSAAPGERCGSVTPIIRSQGFVKRSENQFS